MIVRKTNELKCEKLGDVTKRVAIGPKDGATNFAMRVMELEAGKSSPFHTHDWEHEVYILEGEGKVISDGNSAMIKKDSIVFIPPNEKHYFINTGREVLNYICVVPLKGENS